MTQGRELLDTPALWGRQLIVTRDIDPIYDMLWGACSQGLLPARQLHRWLVAYWCLYHAGAASLLSEADGPAFWAGMHAAAVNIYCPVTRDARWPRSTERRHWRGRAAVGCVGYLTAQFPHPEDAVASLTQDQAWGSVLHLDQVTARVQEWPFFGPWIAFKAADMLERVAGVDIVFPRDAALYESPRRGLEEMAPLLGCETPEATVETLHEAYLGLAPPGRPSRLVGYPEVETIACKWHSARGGHYHIGKDLREIRHGLQGWGGTAATLLSCLPPLLQD